MCVCVVCCVRVCWGCSLLYRFIFYSLFLLLKFPDRFYLINALTNSDQFITVAK